MVSLLEVILKGKHIYVSNLSIVISNLQEPT